MSFSLFLLCLPERKQNFPLWSTYPCLAVELFCFLRKNPSSEIEKTLKNHFCKLGVIDITSIARSSYGCVCRFIEWSTNSEFFCTQTNSLPIYLVCTRYVTKVCCMMSSPSAQPEVGRVQKAQTSTTPGKIEAPPSSSHTGVYRERRKLKSNSTPAGGQSGEGRRGEAYGMVVGCFVQILSRSKRGCCTMNS